jgi:tRNA (cytidine/uridine-2'-O-)-methyltransferase
MSAPETTAPAMNVVLFRPEIPQNTGNLGRLCVATGSRLHLVRPLGFSLEERHLRRAGLDYWRHLDLSVHDDWDAFLAANPGADPLFFSTKAERTLWACPYPAGAFLVFGGESRGLPPEFHQRHGGRMVRIPMPGEHHRSLNLANAVAVAVYEGLRRRSMPGV